MSASIPLVARAAVAGAAWRVVVAWARALPEAERGRGGLWLPVFMAAGALAYLALTAEPPAWSGGVALGAAMALAAVLWRGRAARAAALCAAAMAAGFLSAQAGTWRALPVVAVPSHAVAITARVAGVDRLPDEGRRLLLDEVRLGSDAAPGTAPDTAPDTAHLARAWRLRLRADDARPVVAGETIAVRALLRPPAPPVYPGAWDLQRDAFYGGLGGSGTALSATSPVAPPALSGQARALRALRDAVAARIHAALPDATGAIAATLLTGQTAAIPDDDRAAFRDSGLAHLLAVAGLHIGIVMGLVLGLVRWLLSRSTRAALRWPCKQIAAIAALAAGGAYLLMTGAHVPIMRSFAMACLFTLAVLTGRRALSLRGLALAATAILLIAPWEAGGVSFQMSFAAVMALIAGYEAMRGPLRRLRGDGTRGRRVASHLAALALTSVLAGTASAPFGMYHFGRLQSWFVLSNLIAVPITASWVMPLGLLSLPLMPLGLERYALVPMGWGVQAILWIARRTAALPSATLPVPHMPGWGLAVVALGLCWLCLWRTRWRLAGVAAIALGLASSAFDRPADVLVSPDARVIAVRTGAGAFVETAGAGSRFVTDAFAQYWGEPGLRNLPSAGRVGEAVACAPDACTLRTLAGGAILLLRGGAGEFGPPNAAACAAALVVSSEPARRRCPGAAWIDRFTVWRAGAAAAWLDADGARVLTEARARGDRPWVPAMAGR